MRFGFSFVLTLYVLLFTSCSRPERPMAVALPVYSEDSAMAHYLTEPERSLLLLDSAVLVGNLTPQRAEYLKALVIYNGLNEADSSIHMCQRMLDEEVWKQLPDSEDVTSFRVDLCRLIATIATTTGNHMLVLRYARQGAELAHGNGKLLGDEADCMSRLGNVLCSSGQTTQGLDLLQQAGQLVETDDTWSSLVAYLNNTKKIYRAYVRLHRYADAIQTVQKALNRLQSLPADIQQVRYAPSSMYTDSQALAEFVEYYQMSFYSYLSNIYTLTQQLDEAEQMLQKVAQIPHSDNPINTSSLIHPLIVLGRFDEARQRIDNLRQYLVPDTISEAYVTLLNDQMLLSAQTGRTQEAQQLAQNIVAISDSIHSASLHLMLVDAVTQYQLQDERLRRIDAENALQQTIGIFVIIVIALFALVAFVVIYHLRTKNRELGQKYAKAQQELDEIIQDSCNIDDQQPIDQSPEAIYARAVQLMDEKLYFQNVDLDIVNFAKQLKTNRTYLSASINKLAGMNFRTWVAKYRIRHIKKLMIENRNITYDQLAQECGFDNRTSLYRCFKGIEGITPNEWLQTHKANEADIEHKTSQTTDTIPPIK